MALMGMQEYAPSGSRQRRVGPEATVARIKAILIETNPLEPWHPADVDRITGSGWFLRLPWADADTPPVVLTCYHCVDGVQPRDGIAIQTSATGDAVINARVVVVMPEIDLAVVEVLPTDDVDLSTLVAWSLGDDRVDLDVDSVVHVYGYPLSQERLKGTESRVNGREGGLIQLDGSINFGDSGGPVVQNGKVVGWIAQGVPEANAVSFAQPVSLLLSVLFAIDPMRVANSADPGWGSTRDQPISVQTVRRGGIGCAWYASSADHLRIIGARCQDERGGAGRSGDERGHAPGNLRAVSYLSRPDTPQGQSLPNPFVIPSLGAGSSAAPLLAHGAADRARYEVSTRSLRGVDMDTRSSYGDDGDGTSVGVRARGEAHRYLLQEASTRTQPQPFATSGESRETGGAPGCDCPSGAIIQWVSDQSDLAGAPFHARPGDILCSITLPLIPPGGYTPLIAAASRGPRPTPAAILDALSRLATPVTLAVRNDGHVVLPWTDDRVDLHRALAVVPFGLPVRVRLYRAVERASVEGNVTLKVPQGGYARTDYPFDPTDYEVFAGIVVGPMTANVINAFPPLAARLSPKERQEQHLVILRGFVGGPLSVGSVRDPDAVLHEGDLLERVNGVPVRTMDEYRAALRVPILMIEQTRQIVPLASMRAPNARPAPLGTTRPSSPFVLAGVNAGNPPDGGATKHTDAGSDQALKGRKTNEELDAAAARVLKPAIDVPGRRAYLQIDTDRGRLVTASMASVLSLEPVLADQYNYPPSGTWRFFRALLGEAGASLDRRGQRRITPSPTV